MRPASVTLKVKAPTFISASLSKKASRRATISLEVADAVCLRRLSLSAVIFTFSNSGLWPVVIGCHFTPVVESGHRRK
jgi:hypothetical protein